MRFTAPRLGKFPYLLLFIVIVYCFFKASLSAVSGGDDISVPHQCSATLLVKKRSPAPENGDL